MDVRISQEFVEVLNATHGYESRFSQEFVEVLNATHGYPESHFTQVFVEVLYKVESTNKPLSFVIT